MENEYYNTDYEEEFKIIDQCDLLTRFGKKALKLSELCLNTSKHCGWVGHSTSVLPDEDLKVKIKDLIENVKPILEYKE